MAATYVYVIGSDDDGPVKIGVSAEPLARMRDLQTSNPHKLSLLVKIRGSREDETALHQRFAASRLTGEWFSRSTTIRDFVTEANARLHAPQLRQERLALAQLRHEERLRAIAIDRGWDEHGTLPKFAAVSVREFKILTGLDHGIVYRLIADGQIKSTKLRGRRLIAYSEVERLRGE